MKTLKLDLRTFEDTAKAVYVMNETQREQWDCWEDLQSWIETCAYMHCDTSAFFSTGGFCLTAFETPNGRHVTATLMPYMVVEYLNPFKPSKAAA